MTILVVNVKTAKADRGKKTFPLNFNLTRKGVSARARAIFSGFPFDPFPRSLVKLGVNQVFL